MSLFIIQPDDGNWGKLFNDNIDASHIWNIPGVKCSECGQTWAWIGVSYPCVDLSNLPFREKFVDPWPVSVDVYKELTKLITPLLTQGLPLPPGTELGPLVGKVRGSIGDFAWANLWTLLIQERVYSKLMSLKIKLPCAVNPKLEFEDQTSNELLELQIEPRASLHPNAYSSDSRICQLCKRDTRNIEKIIVDKNSILSDLQIFRITNYPTKILVTEQFRDAVTQLNLTNILFTEIPTR